MEAFQALEADPSPDTVAALKPHVLWWVEHSKKSTESARRSQSFDTREETKRKPRTTRPRKVEKVFNRKRPNKPYTAATKAKLSTATQFKPAPVLRRPAQAVPVLKRPAQAAQAPPPNLGKDPSRFWMDWPGAPLPPAFLAKRPASGKAYPPTEHCVGDVD